MGNDFIRISHSPSLLIWFDFDLCLYTIMRWIHSQHQKRKIIASQGEPVTMSIACRVRPAETDNQKKWTCSREILSCQLSASHVPWTKLYNLHTWGARSSRRYKNTWMTETVGALLRSGQVTHVAFWFHTMICIEWSEEKRVANLNKPNVRKPNLENNGWYHHLPHNFLQSNTWHGWHTVW